MTRSLTVTFGLLVLAAAPALAQVPTPKTEDISPKLVGTWEGPYQSEQAPPGNLRLTIAKEAGAWKVSLSVVADQPVDAAEVRDFKLDGSQLSWAQDIMGMECKSQANLESGTLKGGTECAQGGSVVVTATFVMLKK